MKKLLVLTMSALSVFYSTSHEPSVEDELQGRTLRSSQERSTGFAAKNKEMKANLYLTQQLLQSQSGKNDQQASVDSSQGSPVGVNLDSLADSDQDDNSTQEILNNFAQIVGHFFNIAMDPENPTSVAPEIGGILQNIINIAIIASRNDVQHLKKLIPLITRMVMRQAQTGKVGII